MTDRKQHVQVEQHYYLDYITEYGEQCIADLAMTFDVSPFTAKRKLDGLVAQGKLACRKQTPWDFSVYYIPEGAAA